jgi:alcohol dehydrogenase class IV
LSHRFGIPHGHAVGLTLGAVFALNAQVDDANARDPRGAGWVRERMAETSRLLGWLPGDDVRASWTALMRSLGLETRLGALGVGRCDLAALVESVNGERLANNPRELTPQLLGSMLEELL